MAGGFADIGRLVATLGLNTAPFTAGMNTAQSKMASFTKASMIVGRAMTRFVTLPMALAGAAAVSTQAKFEASMTKIIGLVGVSREQVEKWNKEVLAMARATGRGPEELADALFFVTSAGLRGADAMNVLEVSAKAAAAGLGETKVIADLVTSAMNAYGKENLSAAQATDILVAAVREGKAEADELAGAMGMVLPIASEFGVTFDQVGAAFAGMTRTGTNARVAATQLKAILSAMASPSKQAADAMAEFGLSAEGFRKTVREDGLIQALLDLRMATEGNEDAMAQIFPNIRALMGTLDLLGANVDFNVQIFEALANASGSLSRAFEEVSGTTQQKLNVAMATLKTTFIEVGNLLKGPLVNVLAAVNDRFNSMTKRMQLLTDQQKKLTLITMGLTAAMGPLLLIMSKVMQVVMLNPVTAAIVAFTVLAGVVAKYAVSMQTVNKIQKSSQKQQEKIVENANKEMFAVEKLFHAMKTAKKGSEEWQAARNAINSQYGQYLDNLITEKTSQEELAIALEKVTKARFNDVAAQQYGDEASRLMDQYVSDYTKATKKWTKIVQDGSQELLEETGKTPADFSRALYKSIETASQMFEQGTPMADVSDYLQKAAGDVYDTFIADLENAPKRKTAKNDFMGNVMKTLGFRTATGMEVKHLNEMVQDILLSGTGKGKGVEIDVDVALGKIDEDIAYIKATTAEMTKQESLLSLISLHKKKSTLLSGEAKAANDLIVDGLNEELRIQKQIETSLGSEARAEATIEKLKKERKKLSGDALANNSKALASAQNELAVLQIQTSALSEHQKFGEMIRLDEEKLKSLSGEKLAVATKQVQADRLSYALQESKNSGMNTEQMLLKDITAYKEYGLTLDGEAREANQATIELLEKQARVEAQKYSDAGKLGKLQYDLQELEREATKLSGEKAKNKMEEIRLKNIEISQEENYLAGLNKIALAEADIARMKEDNSRLEGDALKANKEAILNAEVHLLNLKSQEGALTKIEELQLAIAKIELDRLQATDPVKAAALRHELEAVQAELDGLQGGPMTNADFETRGSGEWFKAMKEKIDMLKEIRQKVLEQHGEDSLQYKAADKEVKDSLNTRFQAYAEYFTTVLSAASQFAEAMGSLTESQKQKELSAAGDNAKKREQIEKKYYQKQKRNAFVQALINTALGATNALATGVAPFKWIDFGAVLAAGAVQAAAISAQSFAAGGIVSGPTLGLMGEYPGAKSNPEVIAPLDKLKSLMGGSGGNGTPQLIELKLRGRDAYAMVNVEHLLRNSY